MALGFGDPFATNRTYPAQVQCPYCRHWHEVTTVSCDNWNQAGLNPLPPRPATPARQERVQCGRFGSVILETFD